MKEEILHLYIHPMSSNARKVMLTAEHLGIDLPTSKVDLAAGEHRTADFLARNPNGKVPLLVDGNFSLWESNAIMIYLAELTHEQNLYPKDLIQRADVNRWLFWSACHFAPAAGVLIRERVSKKIVSGLGPEDPGQIAHGEALFASAAAILNEHLSSSFWLSGENLTLADFAIASPLMHIDRANLPIKPFDHIQNWFEKIKNLEAWRMCESSI